MATLPTPTEMIPFTNSLEEEPVGYDRFESVPTADDIKARYLFGVPFEDENGDLISADTINYYVNVAISRFEETFDQPLLPRRFVESHDYKFQDYSKYGFIQLFHFPVLSIDQFQVQIIPATTLLDFPVEWYKIAYQTGQLQITPNTAAVSSFLMSGAGDLPRVFAARSYFPHLLKINYVAGFQKDKIPAISIHWICLYASIQLLRIAGDIIFGAGIQNTSIGLGGLSQSIGTTKGGGGAFQGRINEYKEELKEVGKEIRRFYKSIKLTTV